MMSRHVNYILCVLLSVFLLTAGCGESHCSQQPVPKSSVVKDAGIPDTISNPNSYATMGDIPTPTGFKRISGYEPGFTEYLRALSLKERGAKVKYYTGGETGMDAYAVVNLRLLSNAEQCADVCMHLRADYLFRQNRNRRDIHFNDVSGRTMRYTGGSFFEHFETYLRMVYNRANTTSLSREMKVRPLHDMQPGDVFIFPAPDANSLGHAIMVVDVARNPKTGKKVFLAAQGYTPAMDFHMLRNQDDSGLSPWFLLDESADEIVLAGFSFRANQLKHF